MINTEQNVNGMGINGTCTPAHDKQLPSTLKKTALRDVQNENAGSMPKQQDNLLTGVGKSNHDAVKASGNKRLTPERPSSSQGLPSLTYNGMNENVMNARRRFELELGRGRLQKNVEIYSDNLQLRNTVQPSQEVPQKPAKTKDNSLQHMPVATSNNMTPITAFSSSVSSVPNKQNNSTQATKVSPEVPRTDDIKNASDQLRTERFIHLQKFLKQCDETNQREYMQMLMHLSPAELSKHAVELEKRAIQLTMEEEKVLMVINQDSREQDPQPTGAMSFDSPADNSTETEPLLAEIQTIQDNLSNTMQSISAIQTTQLAHTLKINSTAEFNKDKLNQLRTDVISLLSTLTEIKKDKAIALATLEAQTSTERIFDHLERSVAKKIELLQEVVLSALSDVSSTVRILSSDVRILSDKVDAFDKKGEKSKN